jgi:hypothetical protein
MLSGETEKAWRHDDEDGTVQFSVEPVDHSNQTMEPIKPLTPSPNLRHMVFTPYDVYLLSSERISQPMCQQFRC